MRHIYLTSLFCLFILIPASANAMYWIKDADAIITMRNGNPCFSYPQDDEVRKRPHAFSSLGVSKIIGVGGWAIGAENYERTGLLEPNTPETCIEYGVLNPGMKVRYDAEPLQFNSPYRVNIHLSDSPGVGVSYKRDFESHFCITRNEKGETTVVEASGEGKEGWHCLKPGESTNRGFWGWLFGK